MKEDKQKRTMRDEFIACIYAKMKKDSKIFFLTADFGAPALDGIRKDFPDRFINIGIAEQNLINVATGLSLEGFTVYAYAIAPFLTMRAYEQIRVNLSLFSQLTKLNVNLIGVGAGISYDVAGPTHHCLEDISIMRTLPNLLVFSPSDWVLAKKFFPYSLMIKKPKYLRFDGKSLPRIYSENEKIDFNKGYYEFRKGEKICLISTGYMTHISMEIAKGLYSEGIKVGVIDAFLLSSLDATALLGSLKRYQTIVTLEEAFINKGGLDSLIANIIDNYRCKIALKRVGFQENYCFYAGSRDYLHCSEGFSRKKIYQSIRKLAKGT